MKKTMSLVLCFVLLLGLMPGKVLAEGAQGNVPTLPDGYGQLYLRTEENGQNSYHATHQVSQNTSAVLQFESAEGALYSVTKMTYTIECDTEVGSIAWKEDANTFALWDTSGVQAGASGYIYAVSQRDDNVKYALPVTVMGASSGDQGGSGNQGGNQGGSQGGQQGGSSGDPASRPFALYDAAEGGNEIAANEMGNYVVNFTANEAKTYYFRTEGDSLFTSECNATLQVPGPPVPLVSGTVMNQGKTFAVTMIQGNSGELEVPVTLKIEGAETAYQFKLFFKPGSGNQSGENPPQGGIGALIRDSHVVEDGDIYQGPIAHDTASFVVNADGQDYMIYMIPAFDFGFGVKFGSGGSHGMAMRTDGYDDIQLKPAFFVKLDNGLYEQVTSPAVLSAIEEAVQEPVITYGTIAGNENFPLPQKFPACYHDSPTESTDLFGGYSFRMKFENRGIYVASITATVNGEELTSQTRLTWQPTGELHFSPQEGGGVIGQVNEFLNGLAYDPNCSIMIDLPAGTYQGYISIPEELRNANVFLNGAGHRDHSGDPTTIIEGGLIGGGIPSYIHFRGAGYGEEVPEKWGEGHPNSGRDNIAFSGENEYADFRYCILEGYNIALYCKNTNMAGSTHCRFLNNNTAIYIDTELMARDISYDHFEKNGVAVHFKKYTRGMGHFDFTGSVFIDNDTDIINELKRNIFMPGVFCGNTNEEGAVVPSECIFVCPAPGGVGKKQVFVYPQAADQQKDQDGNFVNLIYDTDFYASNKNKGPMISKNLAAAFPIPVSELSGRMFRIMDPDTGKVVKFTFP